MKNLMGKVNMKMRENRRNGRRALKGFTLVEIIVVLVILAILAAAMIPALTGYIDKAKDRTIVSEARNALTAAQTLSSEAYGLGKLFDSDGDLALDTDDIEKLSEVSGSVEKIAVSTKGKVVGLIYKNGNSCVTYKYNGTTQNFEFGDVEDLTVAAATNTVDTIEGYTIKTSGTVPTKVS